MCKNIVDDFGDEIDISEDNHDVLSSGLPRESLNPDFLKIIDDIDEKLDR